MSHISVVSLDDERPHKAGQAECVSCRHVWTAVAPEPVERLECPSCQKLFGVWQQSLVAAAKALNEAVEASRYMGNVHSNPREAWLIMATAVLSGYFESRK